MRRKTLSVVITWIFVAVAIFALYFLREVSPVEDLIAGALSVWPIFGVIFAGTIAISGWIIKRDFGQPKRMKEAQLNILKLYHDGEDILIELQKAQNIDPRINPQPQLPSEVHFEAWFTLVSNTLKNTEFQNLWYINEVVNNQKDSISDYIGTSERALARLESILGFIPKRR
jgi:hypothetical protein